MFVTGRDKQYKKIGDGYYKDYIDKCLREHKEAGTLDHPDESVTTAKIAPGAVTSERLDKTYVEAIEGKGLSDTNYTAAEKTKLAEIEAGAQVNPTTLPPTDLSVTTGKIAPGAVTPSRLDRQYVEAVEGKGLSDNNYTTTEKTKLSGIQAGAQVNPTTLPPTDLSVTAVKIQDGVITPAKLDRTYVELDENDSINIPNMVNAGDANITGILNASEIGVTGSISINGDVNADYIGSNMLGSNHADIVTIDVQNLNVYDHAPDVDTYVPVDTLLSSKTKIKNSLSIWSGGYGLINNTETRLIGEMSAFELEDAFPPSFAPDYISSVVFTSGEEPTTLSYIEDIKWSGDDLNVSNVFVPVANKRYTIVFWFDGENYLNAVVRGVSV